MVGYKYSKYVPNIGFIDRLHISISGQVNSKIAKNVYCMQPSIAVHGVNEGHITFCPMLYQPHRMGHGQHLNLKWIRLVYLHVAGLCPWGLCGADMDVFVGKQMVQL